MAWKNPLGWGRSGARADADPKDNEPDDDQDDVLTPDDDDEDESDEGEGDIAATPAAQSEASLKAENERLKAENAKLSAKVGKTSLEGSQAKARASAVRLFGQGSPKLKEAKALVANASTPEEASAYCAAWDLAFGATSLAGLGATRQTKTTTAADVDADIKARALAAARSTRPRGTVTVKEN